MHIQTIRLLLVRGWNRHDAHRRAGWSWDQPGLVALRRRLARLEARERAEEPR